MKKIFIRFKIKMSNFVNEFLLTKSNKECKILKIKEEKEIRNKTVQQWIPIEEIDENGIIKINKNKYIKILRVIPINYNLKSDFEKKTILNSYKILLKTCNFDFQILILSNKQDLSKHIKNIKKNIQKKENKYLDEIYENYIKFIQKLNYSKNFLSKNFYLIISNKKIEKINSKEIINNELKEKYFKIKDNLLRCGNDVIEIDNKKEIVYILKSLLNPQNNFYENKNFK